VGPRAGLDGYGERKSLASTRFMLPPSSPLRVSEPTALFRPLWT